MITTLILSLGLLVTGVWLIYRRWGDDYILSVSTAYMIFSSAVFAVGVWGAIVSLVYIVRSHVGIDALRYFWFNL